MSIERTVRAFGSRTPRLRQPALDRPRARGWGLLAAGAVVLGASAPVPASRQRVEPFASEADQAIAILRSRLLQRLTEAMAQGGASGAIDVCSTEATRLATEAGTRQGVEVGRTSFALRNPGNAPRAWAASTVNAAAGKKAAEVGPTVFDLGDRVGVLQPIPVGSLCLACHGMRVSLSRDVSAALAMRYPTDRAVDFREGDLRGFFWAEVRKH